MTATRCRRVGGVVVASVPGEYRKAVRGPDWRAVSLAVRVAAGACQSCGRHVGNTARLQAGHLAAEHELWCLGLRERYLLDRRGLVALCKPCHGLFDLFVQRTRDVRWIGPHRLVRLLRWRLRPQVAEGLRRLARCRAVWLATILAETNGDGAGMP